MEKIMLIFLSDGPSWIFLHLYFRNRKKKIHFFCIIRWFPQTALLPDVWLEQTYFFPIQTLLPKVVVATEPKSKSSQLKYVFKSSSRVGGGIWSTEKPFIAKQVKYLASAKSPLSLQFRSSPMNTRLFLSLLWKLEKLITIFQKIQICF